MPYKKVVEDAVALNGLSLLDSSRGFLDLDLTTS